MDRRIEKSRTRRWIGASKPAAAIAVLLGGLYAFYALTAGNSASRTQKVASSSITVSKVIKGKFEDILSVRGTVLPKTTIYLDAVVGGQVVEKLAEQGEYVKQGQPLVRLSNSALQLEVISREAQISEQLNFLRNTQLQIETTRLDLRDSLLSAETEIANLDRKVKQSKPLVDLSLLPRGNLQELVQNLKYQQGRKQLIRERQKREDSIRAVQLAQLEESATKLRTNLELVRATLDNLLLRAPRAGYLSELNVEIGESKDVGARLGQIDIPGAFKVTAALDEYYLNKVSLGMPVRARLNGHNFEAAISKIDSRVKNAEFNVEVDLRGDFTKTGVDLKRGQSLELEIVMGGTLPNSVMVKRGAFTNETGGNWIFVVSEDRRTANRREIRLGKKNENYYQVLGGLEVGERVIISSYRAFDKAEILDID